MDEKLEPAETKSGRTTTPRRRKAVRKDPEAALAGSPPPALCEEYGPLVPSIARRATRKSPTRKRASGPRPPRSASNDVRTGARKTSRRKNSSAPESLPASADDARSGMPLLLEYRGAPSLQPPVSPGDARSGAPLLLEYRDAPSLQPSISPDDVHSGAPALPPHQDAPKPQPSRPPFHMLPGPRLWPGRKGAGAILLVVGLVALSAVASRIGDFRAEQEASVAGCDVGLCSKPVKTITITDSKPEETPKPQASLPACDNVACDGTAPDAAIPDNHVDEAPFIGPVPSDAKQPQPAVRLRSFPPGIVASRKTGARARVGIAYAGRFQAYIDDLEANHGARIHFIGGIRPGHCATSSLHPCGRALDVCQLRRGVVDSRCHLPARRELARIASSHGLFEGGRWCNSDYGHAQVGDTAGDCGARRTHFVRRRMRFGAGDEAYASFR